MNEIIKSIYERKSVRAYEDRSIPEEMKQVILEAAAQAPTAGCQQLYTILDITDQKVKEALVDTCDHQPFIAKAPLVLIFCADCKKWYDAFWEAGSEPRKPDVGDLMLAVSDAVIAAQNAVVAAESFGIGSCYIGDIMENYEEQRRLLQLPEYVFPAAMLVFGWPTEQQMQRPKPQRVDQKYIVHENTYRNMDGNELRDMFAGHCNNRSFVSVNTILIFQKKCHVLYINIWNSMQRGKNRIDSISGSIRCRSRWFLCDLGLIFTKRYPSWSNRRGRTCDASEKRWMCN